MPKKTGHKKKRGSKRAQHHAHPTGGHHERLRAAHAHHHKRPKRRAKPAGATGHHHRKKSPKRAGTDRHVTEQTLRDHMALACVRRCSH